MGFTIALTAIGTALSAVGAFAQSRSQARAAEFEAQRFEVEAEQDRLDAEWVELQTSQRKAQAQDELVKLIAYNRAGAGYDPFSSPSFFAIESANRHATTRDVDRIELEGAAAVRKHLTNMNQNLLAAGYKVDQARYARSSGLFTVGRTLFTGGADIAQIL